MSVCWRTRLGACNGTRPSRSALEKCAFDPALASPAVELTRCASCGLPQRHEACHARASSDLKSRAPTAATFEQVLSDLHRRGTAHGCRPPCAASVEAEPLTRLLLGLAAFAPSARETAAAVRAARPGLQLPVLWERRNELLKEWSALVRQRLEEGWRRAKACRAATKRTDRHEQYVALMGVGEQMHKAKFVVSDALYIARVLGRVLVEPRVEHSRLVGVPNVSAGTQPARLALHHYFDLQPLCAQHRMVAARAFERDRQLRTMWDDAVVVQPRRGRAFPGGWRLHTEEAVRTEFAHARGARLLVLRGLWRSVTNDEIADERRALPHAGLARPMRPADWEPNPGYAAIARQLLAAFAGPATGGGSRGEGGSSGHGGGVLAIQWRSEDWEKNVPGREVGGKDNASAPAGTLLRCALWAARRARAVMAAEAARSGGGGGGGGGVGVGLVFVATDLRSSASGTYLGPRRGTALAALRRLERALPAARSPRLRAFIDAIPDAGVRAGVEAAVCVEAKLLLSTTDACDDCAKARRCSKMSSAFGRHIIDRRRAYGRASMALF